MRTALLALLATLALVLAPSVATAGGGTKPNATIKVVNSTTGPSITIVAAVDPSNTLLTLASTAGTTLAQLQAQASTDHTTLIVVNAGNTGTLSVKAGLHTLGVVALSGAGTADGL